jgi:AcrR family transcriptional regulator
MAQTNSISRKDQIFEVAQQLFKENGYPATTVRDIATRLNIEAPSLYSHFKSKEEILQAICFRMGEEFLKSIAEVNDIYFNAEQKLRMAIQSHVRILTENLDASAVFLYEWRHLSEPFLSDFKKMRHKYENELTVILENGEDENIFQTVDRKFAVLTILSAVNWIIEWYKPEGHMKPAQIAENLSDFILTGLRKNNPL